MILQVVDCDKIHNKMVIIGAWQSNTDARSSEGSTNLYFIIQEQGLSIIFIKNKKCSTSLEWQLP